MVNTSMRKKLEEMRTLELQLFIIEFNRASQLDRFIAKNSSKPKPGFREGLVRVCLDLIGKIDDGSLSNGVIRKKIMSLQEKYGVSYGQAQKVVNVCLKQYMFLTGKFNCASELDCPLDSTTMKGCGIPHNKMCSVDADDYEKYQGMFSENFELRILKDKKYDEQRIENYFMGETK